MKKTSRTIKAKQSSARVSPALKVRRTPSRPGHDLQRMFGNNAVQRYMKHQDDQHPVIQAKLIVEDKQYNYDDTSVQWTLDHFGIQETGRQYLQSIIESENDHVYKRWGYLGYDLRTRDNIKDAGSEIDSKIGFAKFDATLNETYWENIDGNFYMKGNDYAEAVNAIFEDITINRLECLNLSNLAELRAFQLSVGDKQFNAFLKRRLKGERLSIPLNDSLATEDRDLDATDSSFEYNGEKVFRAGDLVYFSAVELDETANTQWMVENAIVAGWNEAGEPLFKGGGVHGLLTEREMKIRICKNVKAEPTQENINKIELVRVVRHFKALGGIE